MDEFKEETTYTIQTTDRREMNLMLNASKMAYTLYDILGWYRAIYNGKNYGEGCVLYKGVLYDNNKWCELQHTSDEYNEDGHTLKEKPIYLYTEDEIERKLNELLSDISDFIYNYME